MQGDGHVHSQFSWDAPRGDMEATCRRAVSIGLPALAFTEHADFVVGVHEDLTPLDLACYLEEVDRCRRLFPDLRILSGVEMGEPHRYPVEAAAVLASGGFDRILGSVHCTPWNDRLMDGSQLDRLPPGEAPGFLRAYFTEALALVQSVQPFQVLAHLDYPKRYWPHAELPYREEDFEEELRAVLRAAAQRGTVLEVNTTRGLDPRRGLCPGPTALRWWADLGGPAVSFGSDAHDPEKIGLGFDLAADLVEAAGFRPNDDPAGLWLR
ncbi:MAG: histidinol-phosphatase HisJ family protein [Candidatus Dormibacteraeota bacterium]|nr:histidinol-phosphatase HisJ family protein [Candidatus Dormibacteraeota bacterium]